MLVLLFMPYSPPKSFISFLGSLLDELDEVDEDSESEMYSSPRSSNFRFLDADFCDF